MNSRQKGKRGELEFAAYLRTFGFDARRGQQFAGSPESPDVVSEAAKQLGLRFEVKRTEQLRIYDAIDQCCRDGMAVLHVVAYRSNRKPWLAIIPMCEFLAYMKANHAVQDRDRRDETNPVQSVCGSPPTGGQAATEPAEG